MKTLLIISLLLLAAIARAQSSGSEFILGYSALTSRSTWEPGGSVRWIIPRDYHGNLILSLEGNASYSTVMLEVESIIGRGFSLLTGPVVRLDRQNFEPYIGAQVLLTKKVLRDQSTDFLIAAGARRHPGTAASLGFIGQVLLRFDIGGEIKSRKNLNSN
ncbi:MAG: hypothetical protein AB1690_02510 [Candidatus Zixiibacteriota bacterium]